MHFIKKSLVMGVILLAAGCRVATTEPPGPRPPAEVAGLKTIRTCEALTSYLEGKLAEPMDDVYAGAPTAAPDSPMAEDAEETEVEEADIVKQEGNRLYIANSQAGLLVYDTFNSARPVLLGQVDLDLSPIELYVQGTKVVLIGSAAAGYWYGAGKVVVLDLADPKAPSTLRQYDLEGFYANSRKVGGAVYVVSQSWISSYNIEEAVAERDPCNPVYVPEAMDEEEELYSFTSWEIYGIDLNALGEPERVSVLSSSGAEITATPDHFYLTDHSWESDQTGIYLFNLDSSEAKITPAASASVPGRIVDQFSMDETDGVFRIVSTRAAGWAADDSFSEIRNFLTTFRVTDGSLTQLGRIDTIVPGESITAARFVGPKAFVTTFVQIDPLVAIDVSDPTAPRILGELHLPGMTTYIQDWGNYLVAIGSSGGGAWWGGVVLNLFDVTDPNHPRLVEQEVVEGGYSSEAQFEHRAFAFFEGQGILAFPVWTGSGSEVALYRVDEESGFTRLGAVNHDDLVPEEDAYEGYSPTMRRALEKGSLLYTISEAGLKVTPFGDLTNDLFGGMFPGFEAPEPWVCDMCVY